MKPLLRRPLLGFAAVFSLCLVFLASCQTASPPAPTDETRRAPSAAPFSSTAEILRAPASTLTIASFNIQNLSVNKLAKPGVGPELASILRRYDLIAVQEVTGGSSAAVSALLAFINQSGGPTYHFLVSPTSGTTATSGQKEQYAFFYNTATVVSLGSGLLYPDPQDAFVREPFAAQFRARSSPDSFVLLTIHTEAEKPGVRREIAALGPAARWAADHFSGELGVIVLGDFNAGKTYIDPSELAPLRAAALPFLWIVPDSEDTTFADSRHRQAHDRIVVIGDPLVRRFSSRWGVDRSVSSPVISDHLPVWAEFSFAGKN